MIQSRIDDLANAAFRFEDAKDIHAQRTGAATALPGSMPEALILGDAGAEAQPRMASVTKARAQFLQPGDRLALERRIGADDLKPIRYFELALRAAKAVARVVVPNVDPRGDMYGTGFLVAPGLLVTNHHVLQHLHWAEAARVEFGAEDDLDGRPRQPEIFTLSPQTIFFSDAALDFAIVAVDPISLTGVDIADFGYIRVFLETGKISEGEYANIIQHPSGRQKEVCIRNNRLVIYNPDNSTDDVRNNFLYYEADTEGGSSGSPVFSDQWYLIALHRQSVPRVKKIGGSWAVMRKDGKRAREGDPDSLIDYVANEGVRASRIIKRIEAAVTSGDAMALKVFQRWQEVRVPPSEGPISAGLSTVDRLEFQGTSSSPLAFQLEATVRRPAVFAGAKGYDSAFLGHGVTVPLPDMAPEVARATAPLIDGSGHVLAYDHFSVVMNALRRMAFFAAWNIDGKTLFKDVGNRLKWSYDPRMVESYQPHDEIFSQQLQRGHIVRRFDVIWGPDGRRADEHTFTLTNAIPQIANFNNVEWGDLEDHILKTTDAADARISVFAGPVFSADDPFYNDLRRGRRLPVNRRRSLPTGQMRIPLVNWKIVAWTDNGALKAAGFLRDQSAELKQAGPLELDFGGTAQAQALIADIGARTGLRFPSLEAVDTLAVAGITRPRPLGRPQDIIL